MQHTIYLPGRGRQAMPWKVLCLLSFLIFSALRGAAQSAVVCPPNIDFELGNLNNWICTGGTSAPGPSGTAIFVPPFAPGPQPTQHTITSGGAVDPFGLFPVVAPGGGLYSLKLGNNQSNFGAERARYFVHVPVGFNNYSFAFRYAVVFEDPAGHLPNEKPAFQIAAFDSATNQAIRQECSWQTFVAGGVLPGFQNSPVAANTLYLPWTNGTLNLSGQGGKTIIIEVTTFDCAAGAHFGYGYFDIISCGQFQAALTHCDLDKGLVTLEAPAGYAAYRWFRGPAVSGAPFATTRTTNLPTIPLTPTEYICVLTPFSGPDCNDTIRTKPISDFRMNALPDEVCNTLGRPLQLGVVASGGVNDFTYSWTPDPVLSPVPDPFNGSLVPGVVGGRVTAAPFGSQYIICTVTDSTGCFRRDTVRVQNPSFRVDLGPDITTCLNTPIRINSTLTPPGPGYVFGWNTRTRLNDSTILSPTYTPARTGTERYIIRVDSGVCATSDTIDIRTIPDTFHTVDAAVCELSPFTPGVTTEAQYQDLFTYTWSPTTFVTPVAGSNRQPVITPDTSIIYTVTMRYPGCPDVSRRLGVRVEPNPRVDLGPDTMPKCFYRPLLATADVQPKWFSNYTYAWRANTHLSGTGTPQALYTGDEDTMLVVTVRTPLGCTGSDSAYVRAYNGEFGAVSPDDTAVCPKNTIRMSASGGVAYRWSPSTFLSDSTAATVTANPNTSIDYTVFITDRNGCIDTLPVSVQVYSEAIVSLPDSAYLFPGQSYQMDPGGNGIYFDWFPTLGLSNPGIANPVATPRVNTRYFVHSTTEAGCVSTDSIYVMVSQKSAIDVPNAFAPGSGVNNEFRVAHAGLAGLKSFRVFNRWGTLMFQTKDIEKGWDGRFNGEPQPMGVYVYMVEATGVEGQVLSKSGNVTLIR